MPPRGSNKGNPAYVPPIAISATKLEYASDRWCLIELVSSFLLCSLSFYSYHALAIRTSLRSFLPTSKAEQFHCVSKKCSSLCVETH